MDGVRQILRVVKSICHGHTRNYIAEYVTLSVSILVWKQQKVVKEFIFGGSLENHTFLFDISMNQTVFINKKLGSN